MKGAVLLLAILATECYCSHTGECESSSDCGENGFCREDTKFSTFSFNSYRYPTGIHSYCEACPSNGPDGCKNTYGGWNERECEYHCFADKPTSEYI